MWCNQEPPTRQRWPCQETQMITEIVFFDVRKGITRDEVMSLYRQTAPAWGNNTDLHSKYYFFDEKQSLGGGVYIWKNKEAALHWHDEEYRNRIRALYGSEPRITFLDTLLVVDNIMNKITEIPPN
jgi:hypothetical protein